MNEIWEDLNKWRDRPCLRMGRLNIGNMSILPNFIYRFNATTIKVPGKLLYGY